MISQHRFSHPESKPGEIWLANVEPTVFDSIGWKSKRLGNTPYDSLGYRLKGGTKRPVMVRQTEIEAAGVQIPALGAMELRLRRSETGTAYTKAILTSIPPPINKILSATLSVVICGTVVAVLVIVALLGDGIK